MARFTDMNTEGFEQADLDALNAALDTVLGGAEDDMSHVSDRLNNLWVKGATADDLVAAYWAQFPSTDAKIAVLDDCTRTADVIGYAETEAEAADVFMAYMQERMDAEDFAALQRPAFYYRSETSVASPAFEPMF